MDKLRFNEIKKMSTEAWAADMEASELGPMLTQAGPATLALQSKLGAEYTEYFNSDFMQEEFKAQLEEKWNDAKAQGNLDQASKHELALVYFTNHDGDNGKGFRLYNEGWGHVAGMWQAFAAIEPAWAMYGQ